MPIAATARFRFSAQGILRDRWVHDMTHCFVVARIAALHRMRLPSPPHRRRT